MSRRWRVGQHPSLLSGRNEGNNTLNGGGAIQHLHQRAGVHQVSSALSTPSRFALRAGGLYRWLSSAAGAGVARRRSQRRGVTAATQTHAVAGTIRPMPERANPREAPVAGVLRDAIAGITCFPDPLPRGKRRPRPWRHKGSQAGGAATTAEDRAALQ
jgi:hypothetical protein